jgi:mannose-1-phosphate guanylyltransferase / mannose-6-phosphate isomerase
MSKIVPVVLSGGSGTRLWPMSRALYPKQFIRFFADQPSSFLATALQRLKVSEGFAAPLILCNNDHRFLVRAEAEAAGLVPRAIILEPVARNTAPAITVAALMAVRDDPDAIIAVMPSDHVIADEPAFVAAVQAAGKLAVNGRLVLFGIVPDRPHTGYGYIEQGAPIPGSEGGAEVAAFVEKPDRETAERLIAGGRYFWNSGIFVLHAKTFLAEVERLEPAIAAAASQALDGAVEDLGFLRLESSAFASSPDISIDYAVMEKTATAAVLPLDAGWNDVGSWRSLWDISDRDASDNAVHGKTQLEDTKGCYIHSEKSLVAAIGVENLIIVNTPDALLVADKERAQDVGKIVQRLKQEGCTEHQQHLRSYRPWGYFETLNMGPRFQVKLLHVNPGARLSLQMHHHRSEHWIVVHGTAKVTIGESEQLVRENESVYITATQWHRLENPGKVPVELIEVQIGSYLGEDDIHRSDDDYRRSKDEVR